MAGNISKFEQLAKKTLNNVTPATKKLKQEVAQIVEDVVQKSSKQEQTTSRAIALQGQAMVNMQNGKLVKEITEAKKQEQVEQVFVDGYASARAAVKKAPISAEKKEELISDINAQIETRYLDSSLTKKSAKESAQTIVDENPVDLVARKEALKEQYGEKYQLKKQQEQATSEAVRNLRQQYKEDAHEYTGILHTVIAKAPKDKFEKYFNVEASNEFFRVINGIKNQAKNLDELANDSFEKLSKVFTKDGLLFAKDVVTQMTPNEFSPRVSSYFLAAINGELENRNFPLANFSPAQLVELKQRFAVKLDKIEAEEKLVQKKAELMQKHGTKFENRPARKSAKAIQELDPSDLTGKKIELRRKFGNQTIIKSIMLERNVDYDEASKIASKEIEKNAIYYNGDLGEAEKSMEERAKVIIDLLTQQK